MGPQSIKLVQLLPERLQEDRDDCKRKQYTMNRIDETPDFFIGHTVLLSITRTIQRK